MWQNRKGYVHSLHGDTFQFENPYAGGIYRGSPISMRTSNRDLINGIRCDNVVGGRTARQIIDYPRMKAPAPPGRCVDQIPNDGQQLPNGDTVITTFGVVDWAGNPAAGTWTTNFAAMWLSHQEDAEWYEPNPIITFPNSGRYSHFQNQSMILWSDGNIYVFGTNGGRSAEGGIYLMRHSWEWMNDESGWQFWGYQKPGGWSWARHNPTPILQAANRNAASKLGEINAQILGGTVVLSYVDYSIGTVVTQTALAPNAPWSPPNPQVQFAEAPMLYAPAIHPWSTLADTHFALSQWIGAQPGTPFVMYGVRQWHGPTTPIIPSASAARSHVLAGTGAEYYRGELDERGYPTQLPQGPARGVLDGVPDADKAKVLAELSGDQLSPELFQECLDLAEAGEVSPPHPAAMNSLRSGEPD